ncbi:MAG: NAD(P)/FAD-dependent oxidoreductase, partial [Alphaproteobacteria bacterium]|nr:NAD(P)/FAD-dependent oxidoreductase [Alphaproteobacteria bacterium]
MERTECVVIGAGVVGLAIARALALAGREVVVLEAENTFGSHTSSRNTGCIHAGINYRSGSLKAQLAATGKKMLYSYCPDRGVGFKQVGKLLVAVDEDQIPRLHELKETAAANGLTELYLLEPEQVREMEPELRFAAVLHSPTSGIINAHGLMLAFLGEAEDHGTALAVNAPVTGGRVTMDGIELSVGGKEETQLLCRLCINAAGNWASEVAATIEGIPADSIPQCTLAKGSYFALQGRQPFSRLIYPLPHEHAAAVHVSPDLASQLRFGPDTEFVDKIDYTVDPARADFFYDAARRFWPGLKDGDLAPAYAGIRPKLSSGRAYENDFLVQAEDAHGVAGLVNLYGIESPGLTASMAIGEY